MSAPRKGKGDRTLSCQEVGAGPGGRLWLQPWHQPGLGCPRAQESSAWASWEAPGMLSVGCCTAAPCSHWPHQEPVQGLLSLTRLPALLLGLCGATRCSDPFGPYSWGEEGPQPSPFFWFTGPFWLFSSVLVIYMRSAYRYALDI